MPFVPIASIVRWLWLMPLVAVASGARCLVLDQPLRLLQAPLGALRRRPLLVETRLGRGNPAEEVGRVAHEVGADLIVVGHREQSALARWWRGSVGASLLAHAPCSLLVAVSGTAPAR